MFTTQTLWTSDLSITSEDLDSKWSLWKEELPRLIKNLSRCIEEQFDWRSGKNSDWVYNKHSDKARNRLMILGLSDSTALLADRFAKYQFKSKLFQNPIIDCTGFMKGLFIGHLAEALVKRGLNSFTINFGGDILIYDNSGIVQTNIQISWWNNRRLPFIVESKFLAIFSSDNTSSKRGHHIATSKWFGTKSATVVHWFDQYPADNCVQSDICATSIVANRFCHKPNNTDIIYKTKKKVVCTTKEIT